MKAYGLPVEKLLEARQEAYLVSDWGISGPMYGAQLVDEGFPVLRREVLPRVWHILIRNVVNGSGLQAARSGLLETLEL